MAFTIGDGTGSGQEVGVSPTGNRLNVSSRGDERIYYVSRDNGDAYSWTAVTYDAGTNDTILLVKNTSTTQKLYINSISMSCDVETQVIIHCPTAVFTDSGTPVTGTNFNRTSGNVAPATANADEVNNVRGAIIWSGEIPILGGPFILRLHDSLVLGQGQSIGVDYVADAGSQDVSILGFFDIE